MSIRRKAASFTLAAMSSFVSGQACAQASPSIRVDLPAQDLEKSLKTIARISGRDIIIVPGALTGKRAPELHGAFAVDDAVRQLVRPSGATVRFTTQAVLVGEAADRLQSSSSETSNDIVVVGSRIRGGVVTAPVTVISADRAVEEGQTSAAAMMATIPQNFGGGQNPAIGMGVAGSLNLTGGSSFNLRGLGPDATLTLIDGHRVAYGGFSQSVDISSIPFLAIDRLEVVADGGSAIYGSDAVAGVANLILKKGFTGVEAASSLGVPTEGGGFSQQYGALVGTGWRSGNIYASYEHFHMKEINASDRDFSRDFAPGFFLYPRLSHNNAMAKITQEIGGTSTFELMGFYNSRSNLQIGPYDRTGNYLLNGQRITSKDSSFSFAPTVGVGLGGTWMLSLSGAYGQEHTNYENLQWFSGKQTSFTTCLCNSSSSGDLNAEGPLVALPGGDVRLATGFGFRSNRFSKTDAAIFAKQDNYFAYGELAIPIVSPNKPASGAHKLELNIAGRFERYRSIEDVFTPKVGVVYSPLDGVSVRASWGQSFRAPTLYQLYNPKIVALYPVNQLGISGVPNARAALLTLGGNPDLKPERATTYTATVDLQPSFIPRSHLQISYFEVNYRDRIVTPITYLSRALVDPVYNAYVDRSPSEAEKEAIVKSSILRNASGVPYDPANIVGIVRNNSVNAQVQNVRGIDLSLEYKLNLGSARLDMLANGSYITGNQRIDGVQPVTPMAGILYRPAHIRGRAGARYNRGDLTLTTFFNHVGSVTDGRLTPSVAIPAQNTIDLAMTLRAHRFSFLPNLNVTLSIENLNNDLPSYVRQSFVGASPYDPTNYSAVGRKLGLTVSSRW